MSQKSGLKITPAPSSAVWFLVLGVSAITLFLKTDFYDPFNSPKFILLILVASWLLGHLISSYRFKPIHLKSEEGLTLLVILGFVISMSISTLFTTPLITGIIGDTQRRNGFLAYLSLSIILLFASRVFNSSNVLRVYKVGICTGLILSAYGLMQITGNDFIVWNNPYNSMIATLGNPNFASALLAVLLLLGIYGLAVKSLHIIYKVLSLVFIVIALTAIIQSNSRQGLLVIFFSVVFYLSSIAFLRDKILGAIISSLSLLGAILALLGMLQKGPLASLLYKDSVTVRGYYWSAGIEMMKNSPLFGVGVDRYGAHFKEFRDVGYPLKYGFDITSSNAHNTFIQLFATSGLFVGLLYLFLIALVFIMGMKTFIQDKSEDRLIILGLLSAWLGFQAQSLISIDNIGVSVWGWLLGGVILGLSNKRKIAESFRNKELVEKKKIVQFNLLQPTISILVLIPTVVLSSLLYRSETNLKLVQNFSVPSAPQNKQFVMSQADLILNNPIADPYYQFVASLHLYDMGELDKSYENLLKLLSGDVGNVYFLKSLAFFEESRGNYRAAIDARNQLAKGDPWNAENYLQLLILYKEIGDLENSIVMKNKILSFAPTTDVAKEASEILG
jgi:O-antigen ligase